MATPAHRSSLNSHSSRGKVGARWSCALTLFKRQFVFMVCFFGFTAAGGKQPKASPSPAPHHLSFAIRHLPPVFDTAETKVVAAGVDLPFAAGAGHVPRAILVRAEKRAAPLDALLDARF